MSNPDIILRLKELSISYAGARKSVRGKRIFTYAVKKVSFSVIRGKTFAIVGESGCGKTSIAMSVLNFVKPASGSIEFNGINLWNLKGEALRKTRRLIQPVFQDPNSSLNPRMTSERTVIEGIAVSSNDNRSERSRSLLKSVGLGTDFSNKYPHELSGGQKQRLCIARALAPEPELLLLDEPVSAQDISIQAHLINLLLDIKEKNPITFLLISHDLKVVRTLADRIAIMKDGEIIEEANSDEIFSNPNHPYTQQLFENSGIN